MKNEQEIKIEKIDLRIGGKVIELTTEQAKKLQNELDNLFGQRDRWIWWSPYTSKPWPDYPTPWTVTTTSDTKTITQTGTYYEITV